MAKTLQDMERNYRNAEQFAAQNYNAAKGRMTSNWASGVAEVIGGPVASNIVQKYDAKIKNAQYRMGDPSKMVRNYAAKMRGG